jgi:hypothetical protein
MARVVKDVNALRITNQYRDPPRGMVYELACGVDRVALLAAQSDGKVDEWRFEARTAQLPELVLVGEWQHTRAEALGALGRLWTSKVAALGIPSFDWVAVNTALAAVKAV